MALIKQCGRMWARNRRNIAHTPRSRGVYVLYDGSMPVYVGMGWIGNRIGGHTREEDPLHNRWDHFSWYVPSRDQARDTEALLLHVLPFYFRAFNLNMGKMHGEVRQLEDTPTSIDRPKRFPHRYRGA